jgi:hypothetical protein
MARTRATAIAFDALSIEGALIAPDMLSRIAALQAGEQREADYEIPGGLTLRDEIGRYFRIGEALWRRFDKVRDRDRAGIAAREFVTQLLSKVFGFASVESTTDFKVDGKRFPVSALGLGGRVPIVVASSAASGGEAKRPGIDFSLPEFGDGGRRRSATLLLQEVLNASDDMLYGLVSDGCVLRLMRDNPSMTRPAWIEADLERIFGDTDVDDHFADFSALWLLIHQSRFGPPQVAPSDCAFERWREKGREEGVKARERLRDGVEEAVKLLGTGLLQHRDNEPLRSALQSGVLDPHGFFQELLRTIYRFIFLFTAEDRGLLKAPDAHAAAVQLYDEGYSLTRLRTKAVRSLARDRNHDLFEGVRIVFRALERGETRLALPALGGLFLRDRTPHIDCSRLENRFLLTAVEKLAWLREGGARLRINWRDMETEELGSVYESLLELTPRVDLDQREFTFASGNETKGNARKTSGSYYTPDSLVQLLLDSALDPVIEETVASNPGREAAALLELDIIDPACGSGHFLLAAARRLASRIAQLRSPGSPSAEDYRHALREVARHCLYGVDRNPLAVELCQVALWIETVEPGKPLSFLDSRIRRGDSLIGVLNLSMLAQGIPDDAYNAFIGDQKDVASHYRRLNKVQRDGRGKDQIRMSFAAPPTDLVAALRALDDMPEDDVGQVAAKACALAEYQTRTGWFQLKAACDLFVAAFFATKVKMAQRDLEIIPTTDHVWLAAQGSIPHGRVVAEADRIAHQVAAFHWPLMFADVMVKGGFDVVLGNPPWERIKLQEQEFFAVREPAIAEAPNAAARSRLIAKLKGAEPGTRERSLFDEFEAAKRTAEISSVFARVDGEDGGRFPLTGRGDVNTYALFAELFANLTSKGGRAGVIVPTGIATDATTAPFFAALISGNRLVRLIDFENRDAIFPAVHRSYKFSLLTISHDAGQVDFAFFLTDVGQLAQSERRFTLSADAIGLINPNTKTAPVFRSRADAELMAKIYSRVPVLIQEAKGGEGNPWSVTVHTRLWHMAEDSEWFRTSSQLRAAGYQRTGAEWILERDSRKAYVPLYEAKMINFYDHRFGSYQARSESRGYRVLPETTALEYAEARFEPEPYYFVPKTEVEDRLSPIWQRDWLIAFKDVTAATNERTAIFSFLPRFAVGHSAPLLFPKVDPSLATALVAAFNSIVVDYCARTKVGGLHLTIGVLAQLPILPPSFFATGLSFILPRVLELTYTSYSMAPFARDLGYQGPPFAWNVDRRAQLRAELDAFYAHAYGLTRDELRYILDPADAKGADYPSETFRVLRDNEKREFGEYRTARLVLQAFNELAAKERAA